MPHRMEAEEMDEQAKLASGYFLSKATSNGVCEVGEKMTLLLPGLRRLPHPLADPDEAIDMGDWSITIERIG